MGILPERPRREDGLPPLVRYWREVIRGSRAGRWVARHKNASAAVVGMIAALKVWRWLVIDLARIAWHPTGVWRFAVHHVLLAVLGTVAVFVVAFVAARLGLDWFTADEDPPSSPEVSGRKEAR